MEYMAYEIPLEKYLDDLTPRHDRRDEPQRIAYAAYNVVETFSRDRRIVEPVLEAFDYAFQQNPVKVFPVILRAFAHAVGDTLIRRKLAERLAPLFNQAVAAYPAHIIYLTAQAHYDTRRNNCDVSFADLAPDMLKAIRQAEQTVSDDEAAFYQQSKPQYLMWLTHEASLMSGQGSNGETEAAQLYADIARRYAASAPDEIIEAATDTVRETQNDPQSPFRQEAQRILAPG